MSNMHYLNLDHAKLIYTIIASHQFNWEKFLFDQFCKDHTSCISYWALVTWTLEFYKVDLTNEVDQIWYKEFIDKATLKRMKLVSSGSSTPSASSSKQPQIKNEFLEGLGF